MEEFVLNRWGVLGVLVIIAVTVGPRLLDRLTAWAIKHAETDDRTDEKVTDAFIEELRRSGVEREQLRQERLGMTAAQQNLVQTLSGDILSLRGEITGLRGDIHNFTVLARDLEARLSLYFGSRGEKP